MRYPVQMNEGLSKYFGTAEGLQERLGAEAVVIAVIGGALGTGGCPVIKLEGAETGNPNWKRWAQVTTALVLRLRSMADDLERTARENDPEVS